MNCPKCGQNGKGVVRTTGSFYDEKNSEFYRKCVCSKCKSTFYTIEYEIEYREDIDAKCVRYLHRDDIIQSSKQRFDNYRNSKKMLRGAYKRRSDK